MVDNQLLKWGAKEWFMKAGLCRMCLGDFIGAKVQFTSHHHHTPNLIAC